MTDSYGRVTIFAVAKINHSSDEDVTDVWTIYPEGGNPFYVDISLATNGDRDFKPSDEVIIEVVTRFEGTRETPDEDFYVYVRLPEGSSSSIEMFGWNGRYEGNYTIPEDLTTAGTFSVYASAHHTFQVPYSMPRVYWTYSDTDSISFVVKYFDVWAKRKDVTPTTSTFDLYITDLKGDPLESANITYEASYANDMSEKQEITGSGTTDSSGMLSVTVDHEDMGQSAALFMFVGEVTHTGLTQEFDERVWTKDNHSPGPDPIDGFLSVGLTEQPIGADKTTTIEQRVTYEGIVLANQTIYYYFSNVGGVFGHGNATTDDDGIFSATVDVPGVDSDEDSRTHLDAWTQFEVSDGVWRFNRVKIDIVSQSSMMLLDEDVSEFGGEINVSTFSTGDLVNVVLNNFRADGGQEMAFLAWGVGEVPGWETARDLEWESWNPGSINDIDWLPMVWDNGSYQTSFVCPWFLEPGDRIYLYGLIYLLDDPANMDLKAHFATATLGPANPRPTVTIDNLEEGKSYGGIMTVTGTASDDLTIQYVEIRVDDRD